MRDHHHIFLNMFKYVFIPPVSCHDITNAPQTGTLYLRGDKANPTWGYIKVSQVLSLLGHLPQPISNPSALLRSTRHVRQVQVSSACLRLSV